MTATPKKKKPLSIITTGRGTTTNKYGKKSDVHFEKNLEICFRMNIITAPARASASMSKNAGGLKTSAPDFVSSFETSDVSLFTLAFKESADSVWAESAEFCLSLMSIRLIWALNGIGAALAPPGRIVGGSGSEEPPVSAGGLNTMSISESVMSRSDESMAERSVFLPDLRPISEDTDSEDCDADCTSL